MFAIVTGILVFLPVLTIITNRVIQDTFGINETCGAGNFTKGTNQTILNLLNQDYLKKLTLDSPQLAQLLCGNILNETKK